MPVRYQRLTYRYWQGRARPAQVTIGRNWPGGVQPAALTGARRPPVDVWETRDELVVKVMLPGLFEEDIRALLYEDVLVISGQRSDDSSDQERRFHRAEIHYGTLQAEVPLPSAVDPEGVQATYDRGVVVIRLRKRAAGEGAGTPR